MGLSIVQVQGRLALTDDSGAVIGVFDDGGTLRLQVEALLKAGHGLALEATLAAIKNTDGIKKITDAVTIVQATYANLKGKVQLRNPGDTADLGDAANPVRTDPTGTTTQPVSGPLTDAQLRATAVPVSAASLPLPTGAATETTLAGIKTGTDKIPASPSQEHVTAASPHAARLSDGTAFYKATTPADTQPVSAASLPLPSGAATSALQTTGNTSLGNIDTKTPALGQATMAASTPVVIASNQSAVPTSNAAASQADGHSATIGTTTDADTTNTVIGRLKKIVGLLAGGLPAALTVGGNLKTAISEAIAAGTNEIGKVAQGTAAAISAAWPVRITDLTNTMPTMDAAARAGFVKKTDGTNTEPAGDVATRAIFHQLADGTTGPVAVKGANTSPSATDKALVVVLSPNQQALPVSSTPAVSRSGFKAGIVILGGGSSGTLNALRATAYNEQSANGQRSFASSRASDAPAGTGLRTLLLTYYDSTGAGPYTETITLNGTTAVATTNTNICYVESLTGLTAGSNGTNVGTITMYVNNSGGGGTIGTIGIGNVFTGVGDGRSLWGHHYVATGVTLSITGWVVAATASSTFHIKSKSLSGNGAEIVLSELLTTQAAYERLYGSPLTVSGPARVTLFGVPSKNGVTLTGSLDFFEL